MGLWGGAKGLGKKLWDLGEELMSWGGARGAGEELQELGEELGVRKMLEASSFK